MRGEKLFVVDPMTKTKIPKSMRQRLTTQWPLLQSKFLMKASAEAKRHPAIPGGLRSF
jgi:hypothetical protein